MAARTEERSLTGQKLFDREGRELGKLEQVYRDKDSDRPTWGVVGNGRGQVRLVPLQGSRDTDEGLRLGVSASQVEESPRFDPKDEMSPQVERRLRRHYERENGGNEEGGGPSRREVVAGAHERQHERFGGFSWGADFFGWLVAAGVASILTAIVSAAGAAIGLTKGAGQARESADAVGIVGAVLLLLVLVAAYYAGGYVAGRLSRFDGARQGAGVWLIGLLVTVVLAGAGALLGAEYNVLQRLELPRIPVEEGSLTTGGLITLAAIVLGTLLSAIAGGKVGERFHRKVDRVAYED